MAFPGILKCPANQFQIHSSIFKTQIKKIYNLVIEKRNKEIKYKPNSQVVYINKFYKKQN